MWCEVVEAPRVVDEVEGGARCAPRMKSRCMAMTECSRDRRAVPSIANGALSMPVTVNPRAASQRPLRPRPHPMSRAVQCGCLTRRPAQFHATVCPLGVQARQAAPLAGREC